MPTGDCLSSDGIFCSTCNEGPVQSPDGPLHDEDKLHSCTGMEALVLPEGFWARHEPKESWRAHPIPDNEVQHWATTHSN